MEQTRLQLFYRVDTERIPTDAGLVRCSLTSTKSAEQSFFSFFKINNSNSKKFKKNNQKQHQNSERDLKIFSLVALDLNRERD